MSIPSPHPTRVKRTPVSNFAYIYLEVRRAEFTGTYQICIKISMVYCKYTYSEVSSIDLNGTHFSVRDFGMTSQSIQYYAQLGMKRCQKMFLKHPKSTESN